MLRAAVRITQHLPGSVELQDPMCIATSIGMVLLDQGAIGSLDLSCTR